jgi:2-methylisocitrate lyase-like PEP mutase family enzyme
MTDRRLFRQLVEAEQILVLPGVFNGYSARLVERYGYRAAAITGAGVSENLLGWADRGILTFDENLRACRALAECCNIPLLADADTGYGNALNVYFVTRAFEQAGLAAISIEDQVWPKRCGHLSGKTVISAREMADKVKAAVDARRDGDFMIRARTDAAATDGIPEVIDRLNLYAEAGADIVFADALMSTEDIAAVAKNVSKPLAVNMGFGLIERGTTPLVTPRRLQELGAATVSYSRMLTSAALRGMMNALEAFAPTVGAAAPTPRPDLMVPFGDLNELMGLKTLEELEAKWASNPSDCSPPGSRDP